MSSVKDNTSNFLKVDKFLGVEFQRWQKKISILLTSLNVPNVINTPKMKEKKGQTLENTRKHSKWKNSDFIFQRHILNGMNDSLFDIYPFHESTKIHCDSLENKCISKHESS